MPLDLVSMSSTTTSSLTHFITPFIFFFTHYNYLFIIHLILHFLVPPILLRYPKQVLPESPLWKHSFVIPNSKSRDKQRTPPITPFFAFQVHQSTKDGHEGVLKEGNSSGKPLHDIRANLATVTGRSFSSKCQTRYIMKFWEKKGENFAILALWFIGGNSQVKLWDSLDVDPVWFQNYILKGSEPRPKRQWNHPSTCLVIPTLSPASFAFYDGVLSQHISNSKKNIYYADNTQFV